MGEVVSKEQLVAACTRLRREGKRIVFTNGCFDLLHFGHVDYLKKAKSLGDILVVGLNDDASVRRLKGSPRPIMPQADRVAVVAALASVELHQDPLDFPPMKVLENFLIGQEAGIFPNRKKASTALWDLAAQFGFSIDPQAYVDSLTGGERQQLEIVRLLWLGARVLIFDEPTTGISATQKLKLFATLLQLAKQGKTIIFVSHKLEDVEVLCDQVAVLRQGFLVGEAKPSYKTDHLVEMMFGKTISIGERTSARCEDVTLRLVDLSMEDYRLQIKPVNLELYSGDCGFCCRAWRAAGPWCLAVRSLSGILSKRGHLGDVVD